MAMQDQNQRTNGTMYAINKTAGKAFRRAANSDEWEAVDPKSITITPSLERAGHQKIGNNWFSVYKASE